MVFGASDGIITTFALVAGVAGAALAPHVAVILGIANLVADGISMGASNYLALRSELAQTGRPVAEEKPLRHGVATFLSFAVVGAVPLAAYAVPVASSGGRLWLASAFAGLALAGVGVARARLVGMRMLRSAMEMVLVGGLAGVAAFAVGATIGSLLV